MSRRLVDFRVEKNQHGRFHVLMDGQRVATETSTYTLSDVKVLVTNILELLFRGAMVELDER